MSRKNVWKLIYFAIIVVAVQLLTAWTETGYYLTQLTMTAYYSLVIIGLCMLIGYTGQISLGHAGFFGVGGYASGTLTTYNLISYQNTSLVLFLKNSQLLEIREDIYGDTLLTFHPWIACITAILTTFLIAFIIGIPVMKLKGHYLAMATLGVGAVIYRIVLASEIFGEADGISEVPTFTLLPGIDISGDFDNRISNFYAAYGILLIGIILLLNLVHSRSGRALRAIHGSEEAAQAMGINTARYKLNIFVISAVFASIAGILMTHYNGGIGPSDAGIMTSIRWVAIVAIGGMANLWGTLIMSIILNFMSLRGIFGAYDDAMFGIILILFMLFAPRGITHLFIWPKFRSLASLPLVRHLLSRK